LGERTQLNVQVKQEDGLNSCYHERTGGKRYSGSQAIKDEEQKSLYWEGDTPKLVFTKAISKSRRTKSSLWVQETRYKFVEKLI